MCGIVGYVGRRPGKPIILDGLRRLEYRGYDSAGIVLVEDGGLETVRAVGNLDALYAAAGETGSDSCVGLGHTRWATHGRPSEENAHPHGDCSGRVSIVLNGIIENYKELRARLGERGHTFTSETDAEVVAHLIEEHIGEGLTGAVRAAARRDRGALRLLRRSPPTSPTSWSARGTSARSSWASATTRCSSPRRSRRSWRTRAGWSCSRTATSSRSAPTARSSPTSPVQPLVREADGVVPCDDDAAEKGGYETFMLKEIHEQPAALRDTLAGRLREDGTVDLSEVGIGRRDAAPPAARLHRRLRHVLPRGADRQLRDRAAGARAGADRRRQRVPLSASRSSTPDTLVIGITQSGETADTLAAMRLAREAGSPVLALTNIMGSQATRDADFVLYTRAGPGGRGGGDQDAHRPGRRHAPARAPPRLGARRHGRGASSRRSATSCAQSPSSAEQLLARPSAIEQIAQRYHDERFFLYLGRGMGFAVCLEGALKLKEISYIPTEAYAAGEMKHGPIALLDNESPVVVVADDRPIFPKLVSNIEEVRARGADVIAVATDGNDAIGELSRDVLWIPKSDHHLAPILAVIPLQLLAYHIAGIKGLNVDQPRNLAKTVTVE